MKTVVTISRYWNSPAITTSISQEGISLQTDMADFLTALVKEMGSVTWVVTNTQFREKLDNAVRAVIEKIKEESIKVV